jgi:hypothetical protein
MNSRKLTGACYSKLLIVFAIDAYFDGTVSKIRNLLLIKKKYHVSLTKISLMIFLKLTAVF